MMKTVVWHKSVALQWPYVRANQRKQSQPSLLPVQCSPDFFSGSVQSSLDGSTVQSWVTYIPTLELALKVSGTYMSHQPRKG